MLRDEAHIHEALYTRIKEGRGATDNGVIFDHAFAVRTVAGIIPDDVRV